MRKADDDDDLSAKIKTRILCTNTKKKKKLVRIFFSSKGKGTSFPKLPAANPRTFTHFQKKSLFMKDYYIMSAIF